VPRELAPFPVDISPDGTTVIASDDFDVNQTPPDAHTLKWQRSTGWQALPGLNLSMHHAVSHDFKYVVGTGRDTWDGPDQVWVQALDGAPHVLPASETIRGGYPLAVSDDGNTVVGVTMRFMGDWPVPVAVRWDNLGQPTIIHDPEGQELAVASACDANCNIIFGAGLFNYDPAHVHPWEAWYLKKDGAFGYFGALADAPVAAPSYAVTDAVADGSLAVGTYSAYWYAADPNSETTVRAFIWTEATGIVSVRSLINDLGIGEDDWDDITSVRISPDGAKILLGGYRDLDHFRAAVLQLTPKLYPE
jgi:hypothetical protein